MRIQVTSKEVDLRGRQISSRLTGRQTAVGVEIEIESESEKDCVDD